MTLYIRTSQCALPSDHLWDTGSRHTDTGTPVGSLYLTVKAHLLGAVSIFSLRLSPSLPFPSVGPGLPYGKTLYLPSQISPHDSQGGALSCDMTAALLTITMFAAVQWKSN